MASQLLIPALPVLTSGFCTVVGAGFFAKWYDEYAAALGTGSKSQFGDSFFDEEQEEDELIGVPVWQLGIGLVALVCTMAFMLFLLNSYPEIAGPVLQVFVAIGIGVVVYYILVHVAPDLLMYVAPGMCAASSDSVTSDDWARQQAKERKRQELAAASQQSGLVQNEEEEGEEELSGDWWPIASAVLATLCGALWFAAAHLAHKGVMRGVNDVLVLGAAVVVGGVIQVPSFSTLSILVWVLFAYDYTMTIAISGSLLTACHTEMCGALDIIEDYRLPMALRFWNGSALGMGDLVVGAVCISFAMRRYGYVALWAAVAYVGGLWLAVYWSSTREKPVPALVPIVPLVWGTLALMEMWHTRLGGLCGRSKDDLEDDRIAEGASTAGERCQLVIKEDGLVAKTI